MSEIKHRSRPTNQRGPHIERADNGFFYIHWSDGRRSKRASTGTKDEGQARTVFGTWLVLEGGKGDGVGPAVDRTVDELWKTYDARHVQSGAVMPSGRDTIGYAWKNLAPHFGPLLPGEVVQSQVDAYVKKRRAAGAAAATIRREIATLLAGLRYCATKKGGNILDKAVAAEFDDIDLPPDSPPRDKWLSIEQVQKLLDAAVLMRRGDRLSRIERFIWLALFTTGRQEALLELTWDRVDFTTDTIHLNVPGRRVTKKRRADVSIATQLRPVLLRAYDERVGPLVLDHGADDIWAGLQYVAIRAGFSDQKVGRGKSPKATGVSAHVFRHSGATHMARGNVPLWKVAKTLGDTMQTTERVYAKWVPEHPEGTVDLISGGKLEAAE